MVEPVISLSDCQSWQKSNNTAASIVIKRIQKSGELDKSHTQQKSEVTFLRESLRNVTKDKIIDEKDSEHKNPRVKEEKTFLSVILNKFPELNEEEAKELINKEISDKEVEPYLSLLAAIFPDIDVKEG